MREISVTHLSTPQAKAKQSNAMVNSTGLEELPSRLKSSSMDANEKFALISENLAEVLNPEVIESILAEGRNVRIYWGYDLLLS
jgi:hypothetical protein